MKEVKPSKKPLAIYYAIVLLVLLVINLVVMPWLAERQVQEVDYGTFMSMTEQENIGKVDIQSNQIIFTDKDNKQIYKTGLMNDPGLTERLYDAGVPAIEIERKNDEIKIMIQCARPGMVVGRGGEDIKKLEEELTKKYGKKVRCSIIEIKNPDTNATLVAENIAAQLEKRIGFRRAMKQSMGRAMRMGAKGIKVSCGGRLGGADIARTEHYHDGSTPLQTLRANIDYGFAEAKTTYGRLGVKVWIYKGQILPTAKKAPAAKEVK